MKRFHPNPAALEGSHRRHEAGMATLTEVMVAAVEPWWWSFGTGFCDQQEFDQPIHRQSALRQNTVNGMRLMRSEIERSIHLAINKTGEFSEGKNTSISAAAGMPTP